MLSITIFRVGGTGSLWVCYPVPVWIARCCFFYAEYKRAIQAVVSASAIAEHLRNIIVTGKENVMNDRQNIPHSKGPYANLGSGAIKNQESNCAISVKKKNLE